MEDIEDVIRDEAMLRKVGDWIAENPEKYNQDVWIHSQDLEDSSESYSLEKISLFKCGTTACVAGTAAFLWGDFVSFCGTYQMKTTAGQRLLIKDAAQEALGLEESETWMLFDAIWQPAGDESVPLHLRVRDALYKLADGASIEEVSVNLEDE